MYLKSLTLKGFKSFPDRTRMEFGPGVSVIVGPNGSGKSNVTDAVLWALGEQSPLAVRGHSMQDIIFSGTQGRRAAAGAEVELVLDDSENKLGLGTSEVSISRRLDRSGEGEYRLAGARCRLVDVMEVLSDTGLGKEMHSVISQGRVEAIVTSKPRDRRMLIEEAAGLGKHRKRRRRAQLKLTRARENLDRALDVEREARTRLRPLRRQAEAAEQHERLARQLLEAAWELGRDELLTRGAVLSGAELAAVAAREARSGIEGELAKVSRRRDLAEEALSARSAQREELSRRVFQAQNAGELVRMRGEAVAAQLETAERRHRRAVDELGQLREIAAGDVPDEGAAGRIAELTRRLSALDADRKAELARQLAELEAQLGEASKETARRAEACRSTSALRAEREQTLQTARAAVREAERGVEAARREAARVGGELAAVAQFLRSHAALPGGATALADGLRVQDGYERAVAAALDGRLRAAVVADRAEGERVLERSGADGGVTLLRELPAGADPAMTGAGSGTPPALEGAAGTPPAPAGAVPLAEQVGGEGPAVALAHRLLADTWVVESLEDFHAGFRGVAVTRQGKVWVAGTGELRQAPKAGAERVLQQRNLRDRLVRDSEVAAAAEVSARRSVDEAVAAAARAERASEEAVEEDRAAVRARDEAAEGERRLAAQIQRRRSAPDDGPAAAERAQVAAELAAEQTHMERADRERLERARRITGLEATAERQRALTAPLETLHAALVAVVEAIGIQRARFEQDLEADRRAAADVSAELKVCATEEANLQGRLHRASETLTAAEVALQRAQDQLAESRGRLEQAAQRLGLEATPAETALDEEARGVLRGRIERLEKRKDQLGPVNPLAADEYQQALQHVEEMERQRTDLETAMRELRTLIDDTDRQIRTTFEETFAAAATNFEELAKQLFPGGKGHLRLVRDGEGAATRAPVLGGEAADEEAADDGDDSAEEAKEDLLGVEIEITPAGKEMKRLTLLSGGEKSMTALAFLFSVFLARPCPFYILDEVEAALDDLNIDRFLELLRQNATRAQFIVVTHQKRTMEAADSLYGVSMGGDGISKVISRRLPARVETLEDERSVGLGR